MRILFVSQMTPYLPCHDGFRTVAAQLVRNLAARHTLALVAAATEAETPEQRRWAARFCAVTESVPVRRWWGLRGRPTGDLHRLGAAARRQAERLEAEVLFLEGILLAPLARTAGLPTVLSIHDSLALRAGDFARLARSPSAWLRARLGGWWDTRWERRWLAAADARLVLSEPDRAAVEPAGGPTEVVPLGVDLDHYQFRRASKPRRIVFTGNLAWPPNVDAARWLATAIFPAIRRRRGDAELLIAGADPAPAVRKLERLPGVRVTGTVPDLRPSLWSAAVAVSPVRAGYGMKNKVLEAMALGTPVVATARSLTGLGGAVHGEHLLVADAAEDIAAAVLRLTWEPKFMERSVSPTLTDFRVSFSGLLLHLVDSV